MFASKDLFFTKPSGGYQISRSVRTRSSATAYFNRTFSTPTLGTKWTWSGWVKRGTLSSAQTLFGGSSDVNNWGYVGFLAGDTLTFQQADAASVTSTVTTTQVFRDPAAWYHIVVAFDSTQATAANRLIMYVNGVQITAFGTATYLAQNTASRINQAVAHTIYRLPYSAANYVDGYLTEANFIDGQALTPSSFGSTNTTTGVWQPAKYGGTYGTNGFYLNFSDNSAATATTIGKDYSGNGNNWTPNNISVTAGVTYDSMLDSPTPYADGGNGRGNYCVLNPIDVSASTVSNGNLNIAYATNSDTNRAATFGVSSGKWYWETTITAVGGTYSIVGITSGASTATALGTSSYQYAYISSTGNKFNNGSSVAYGSTYTTGDVIGIALDMDAGTLVFYKNNTSQGTAYTGLSGTFFPAFNARNASNNDANFGQRPFTYTPPTGYVALNTQNLPTPTISNGAQYMAASTYTGTGATLTISNSTNNPAGITFQPDFVWVKGRSGATDHALYDSVRGATKDLVSNSTAAETTQATGLTAFGSTGFTVGALAKMNTNAATYVGWQWKASGSTVSNTNGSITSTVSVGATQGFSVVTYTGIAGGVAKTFGHGLGVAPSMVIVKGRDTGSTGVNGWVVWHSAFTGSEYIYLDLTNAKATSANYWGATVPSSTVVTVGGNASNVSNESGIKYVAYCFAAVAGYSAFGSYTGNGSTDGTFVFTGFRPRYVLIKVSSGTTGDWQLQDTSRNTYNCVGTSLFPNGSYAEATGYLVDILSNGFKLRTTAAYMNGSGNTMIYAAFAENPFKNSLAR